MSILFSKCDILDRIKDFYSLKTNKDLADFLGIGTSTLSNWYTRNSIDYDIVFTKCESVNWNWLITGNGPTQKEICENSMIVAEFAGKYDKKHKLQHVPLYRLDPTAGLTTLFMDDRQQKPIGHIDIPNLPKCDGATYIVGDSMYPLLKSGDIVLYKKVTNLDYIITGEMYMLDIDMDGDDYITVKWVNASDRPDHILLVSQNSHHEPLHIPKKAIRNVALIKASIRFNTLR